MSDAIVAALISAGASIAVGLIGKSLPARAATPVSTRTTTAWKSWRLVILCLGAWLLISPAAIHHDFAGINYFVIAVVIVLLAFFSPLPPLSAAWISLAVYSANFLLGPLSNRLAGSGFDNKFIRTDLPLRAYAELLALAFATALLSGFISWLRLRHQAPAPPREMDDRSVPSSSPTTPEADLVGALERLGELHRQGILSDEEFRESKRAVLTGRAGG